MPRDPGYYAILGLQPEADAAAIDAAYRGRSLKFRVKQSGMRGADQAGPTQDQIEQAFAILGDPESRALYDAVYFPTKQAPPKRRSRVPFWLWVILVLWLLALLAAMVVGVRSRMQSDGGAIGRIAGQTATVVAALQSGTATSTPSVDGAATVGSPTLATALPRLTSTSNAPVLTAAIKPTATVTAMLAPTTVPGLAQTVAVTMPIVPTVTLPPPATATTPPTATPEPPLAVAPEPTAPPSFDATDRIGTALSVNLRNGPGIGYASLGLLPTGTLLQATGETVVVGGQLWRRFVLQDGRVGWVRDSDVFSMR